MIRNNKSITRIHVYNKEHKLSHGRMIQRKLTLFGKITVVKSFIFSKFVHLFIAPPNPPAETVKTLEKDGV